MMRLLLFPLLCFLMLAGCRLQEDAVVSDELPPVYPDYTDVTIPCNVAPLNFLLRNQPKTVEVNIKGKARKWKIQTAGEKVQFPENRWRALLEAEAGGVITVTITATVGKERIQYAPFQWRVTVDKIDPYLSYRLIEPGYEVWNAIQLKERNIETFAERVIADNNLTEGSCMNCHIYGNQDPNLSFFHLRGQKGGAVLNRNGQLRKLDTKVEGMASAVVYGNFHPSGRYGIFSTNIIIPEFHTFRSERLEVYDTESNLVALDFDTKKVIPFPADTSNAKPLRTFPVFSADGLSVYYCEAPAVALPDSIRKLMYSLYRIDFDPASGSFGSRVDTLFDALQQGKSVCHPKTSPDGRYLLYTVADYGTFPIWRRETDLRMIDLQTGAVDSLSSVNAACSDTYHSWSSNSRWFVFASKRDDGLYGKPYFSYVDSIGTAHKPFVLPQRDPAKYDYILKSFNIPELSRGPLPFAATDIEALWQAPAESCR
jgi:hypothetical protein